MNIITVSITCTEPEKIEDYSQFSAPASLAPVYITFGDNAFLFLSYPAALALAKTLRITAGAEEAA